MKKYTFSLLATILTASYTMANDNLAEIMASYPAVEKNVQRYAIELPKKENENNFMVEFVIGKTMLADCNLRRLQGRFEKKPVSWKYDYYELKEVTDSGTTTLMGCHESEITNKFITVHLGDGRMVPYSSRSPIVVYVPKDIEVKYRVWSAPQELETAVIK